MLRKIALAAVLIATGFALPACTTDDKARSGFSPRTDVGFFLLDEGLSAKLAYGEADSDNVGLMLQCAKGSKVIEITDVIRSAPAPTLTLTSGGVRSELQAQAPAGEGVMVARASTTAPALAGFRKSGRIEVAYAGLKYGVSARPQERMAIERFFTACERRAV